MISSENTGFQKDQKVFEELIQGKQTGSDWKKGAVFLQMSKYGEICQTKPLIFQIETIVYLVKNILFFFNKSKRVDTKIKIFHFHLNAVFQADQN